VSPKASNENHQLGIVSRTLEERLDGTGPGCSIRPFEGQWRIYLDDEPLEGAFDTSRKALAAARRYKADRQRKVAEDFFVTTGLSSDLWTLNANALVSKIDPVEFVVFYRRAYMAHIGYYALPSARSVHEAIELINATFHLPSPVLHALEQVYGEEGKSFGIGSVDWSLFGVLRSRGFLSFQNPGPDNPVYLTEIGRAALGRDPRGLPLDLREIIFAGASPKEFQFRPAWNALIGSGMAGQANAQGLRRAVSSGLELRLEIAGEEQYIVLRGSGLDPDGSEVQDCLVASFPSHCEHFKAASKSLGEAIVHQQAKLAEATRSLG